METQRSLEETLRGLILQQSQMIEELRMQQSQIEKQKVEIRDGNFSLMIEATFLNLPLLPPCRDRDPEIHQASADRGRLRTVDATTISASAAPEWPSPGEDH